MLLYTEEPRDASVITGHADGPGDGCSRAVVLCVCVGGDGEGMNLLGNKVAAFLGRCLLPEAWEEFPAKALICMPGPPWPEAPSLVVTPQLWVWPGDFL